MSGAKPWEHVGVSWKKSRPTFDGSNANDRKEESPAVAALRERFKKVKAK